MLGHSSEAPAYCEPAVNEEILMQHLYSPAMLCIFQLQDILGISQTLRRQNPHDERINIPANPTHFWKYRMHLLLEDLLKEKEFNEKLNGAVKNAGR
jgi:4-alpha-glucanotransferase